MLERKVDQNWDEVSSSLEDIRKSLICKENCIINLTAEGKNLTKSLKFVSKFADMLPCNSPFPKTTWTARLPSPNEDIIIPTPVIIKFFFLQGSFIYNVGGLFLTFTFYRLIMLENL